MKLKNKRTGEIIEFDAILPVKDVAGDSVAHLEYDSLAELNEEWEEHKEPKEYWFIAEMCGGLQKKQDTDNGEDRFNKQIGNYFETEEEAEKAVEKLKAWKRLKDKGFEVELRPGIARGEIRYYVKEESNEVEQDLQICFGGEE